MEGLDARVRRVGLEEFAGIGGQRRGQLHRSGVAARMRGSRGTRRKARTP
jgi:hypothetical protein